MLEDREVREQIVKLLKGGMAHMPFDEAVADFPPAQINQRPPHVPYTPWHLLEHLRLTQRDILEFITNPDYQEGNWPDDYWPSPSAEADSAQWEETIRSFREDLATLQALAEDASTDLGQQIPWGDGQTILREFLLVADHNAYHIGEFAILRQVMQTWPVGH